MSRRRAAKKRKIIPDARFNSIDIAKFINKVMVNGKKSAAERIVYEALDNTAEKLNISPLDAFNKVLENVEPLVEVRSRRVGGATYQVPVEIRPSRRRALAMKWLINAARSRKSEKTMDGRLAGECTDAYNNRGAAVKKRDDTHRMAEANRAFSHYRW